MPNNTFNWQRFLRTLRWDLLSNKKTTLRYTAGMTFGLSLLYLFLLRSYSNRAEVYGYTVDVMSTQLWNTHSDMAGVTGLLILLIATIAPCFIFMQMKTKQQRAAFLMLPASNLEKWLVRFVSVTVVVVCMMGVAIVTADLIRFVFALFLTPGHYDSVVWHLLEDALDHCGDYRYNDMPLTWFASITLTASWGLLNHSFYTMGGALFRRQPLLLTMASQFFIGLVLLLLGAQVAFNNFESVVEQGVNIDVDIHYDAVTASFVFTVCAVFILLSLLFYWLSYKLFTRMQVINNKWLNL